MARKIDSIVGEKELSMSSIQTTVSDRLEAVQKELSRIVVSDFGMIEEVNQCLLAMKGKLFRPPLVLLAN